MTTAVMAVLVVLAQPVVQVVLALQVVRAVLVRLAVPAALVRLVVLVVPVLRAAQVVLAAEWLMALTAQQRATSAQQRVPGWQIVL